MMSNNPAIVRLFGEHDGEAVLEAAGDEIWFSLIYRDRPDAPPIPFIPQPDGWYEFAYTRAELIDAQCDSCHVRATPVNVSRREGWRKIFSDEVSIVIDPLRLPRRQRQIERLES